MANQVGFRLPDSFDRPDALTPTARNVMGEVDTIGQKDMTIMATKISPNFTFYLIRTDKQIDWHPLLMIRTCRRKGSKRRNPYGGGMRKNSLWFEGGGGNPSREGFW